MIHNKNAPCYLQTLILAGLVALLVAGCQGGTTDPETGEEPSATKQTLGLLGDLIANCNDMLEKIAGRKEHYASTGDVRGEQLMGEAADNVKDIKKTAFAIKRDIAPGETASISLADSSQDVQTEIQEIDEARNRLEENLAEAKSCCALAPDFLDEDLEKLRAQTNDLEEQVEQIESERTVEPEHTVEPERSAQEEQYG